MQFYIKTDANEDIGSGHLQRCLNLAEFLKSEHDVTFLFCNTSNLIINEVKKNFKTIVFQDNKNLLDKIKKNLKKNKYNFLILDDYSTNYTWEKAINNHFSKVLIIGDHLNKKHYCDFYLNQNVIDDKSQKSLLKKFSSIKCLLGPKYALLDKNYLRYAKKEKNQIYLKNIIISFGGSDKENLTDKVLSILSQRKFNQFKIKVAIGRNYQYFNDLSKKYKSNNRIIFYKGLNSLAKINHNSDLSIGAGGISTWERLCLSLPSLVFLVSDNQKVTINALRKKNFIIYAGKIKKFDKINFEILIKSAKKNYKKIVQKMEYSKILVDGRGVVRVAEILSPTKNLKTVIRKAKKEDLYDYYNWVNDKEVRKNSFNGKKVEFENHKKWFYDQLKFPKKNFLYVFGKKNILLGQTRLNLSGKIAKIDYSIDKDFRQRGLGYKMLKKVLKKKELTNKTLCAEVKNFNTTSINIFKNLKFNILSEKNRVVLKKFN